MICALRLVLALSSRRLEHRHLQCLGEDLLQEEGARRPERIHEAIPPAAARLAPALGGEDATRHAGHPQRSGRVREESRGYRRGGRFPRLGRVTINSQTQAAASVGAHPRAVQVGAHERYLSTDYADGGRCVFVGAGGRCRRSAERCQPRVARQCDGSPYECQRHLGIRVTGQEDSHLSTCEQVVLF